MDPGKPSDDQYRPRHVTVRDGKAGLPYSKGLMATSVMAAGLPPPRAYYVAEIVEQRLHTEGRFTVASDELRELVGEVLEDEIGPRYAGNYRTWQRAQDRKLPLIVLVGGTTGVGKSTVATTIAHRLGIVRIVSTDAVREVLRGVFKRSMMPALHTSSFSVASALREPLVGLDPVLTGFRLQVEAVAVGLARIIRRAAVEGTDLIVEGVHVVPGFLQLPTAEEAIVAPMVITVDDEEIHRSHFVARSNDARAKKRRRYLDHFDDIRVIQDYVKGLALEQNVPVVTSYSLDATVSRVMELVVAATSDALAND